MRNRGYAQAKAITTSDTDNEEYVIEEIYVGAAGNLTVVLLNGDAVPFLGALAGTVLPIQCKRVNATGLTAGSLVGFHSSTRVVDQVGG
jgi:hypothetical protein